MTKQCLRVKSVANNPQGLTVTFVDNTTLDIPFGFQADCIGGNWIVVKILTPPPTTPVG